MTETFAHSIERTQSRPSDAFMEVTFDPGPGGGGISVGVTGGPVEIIPGESFDDPPIAHQRAAVLVEVLAPGVATPVASTTWSLFAPNGDLARVLGFTVPTRAEPGWRCRVRNIGDHAVTIRARVTFTETQPQMLQTPIPIRTLNNALHQLLDILGPQVRLDGDKAFVQVSRELTDLIDVPISSREFTLDDPVHDVRLVALRAEVADRGLGVDLPVVRFFVEFETLGPVEIKALGFIPVDVTEASIEIDMGLGVEGALGERRIAPGPFTVRTNIGADLTRGFRVLVAALGGAVAGPPGAIEVLDWVRDRIDDKIRGIAGMVHEFVDQRAFRDAVGEVLTEGFLQLAERDHVFHDLAMSRRSIVVTHYDPKPPASDAAPPEQPSAVRVARRPQAPRARSNTSDTADARARLAAIDTIVVLMQENRSFDHVLGHLSLGGSRPDIDGLTGSEQNSAPGDVTVGVNPLADEAFGYSPFHHFDAVTKQIADGAMSGFLASFIERFPTLPVDDTDPKLRTALSYFTRRHLPVTDFLAEQFLVCNRWFCSFPGATQPNRFCTLTGSTPVKDNFPISDPILGYLRLPTLFETLTLAGVEWAYYEHDVAFLRFFDQYRLDDSRVLPIGLPDPERDTREGDSFFARARAGTLPPVVFIDPNFVDVPPLRTANDDHAPADIGNGQRLIHAIYNALLRQPDDRFARTLFILTYDEHGGFYDHVPPPVTRATRRRLLAGPGPIPMIPIPPEPPITRVHREAATYGVRVPTLLISPRVRRRSVTNVRFDHTSIAKTILLRFLGPDAPFLSARMAEAAHLGVVLEPDARTDRPRLDPPPADVPRPPVPGREHPHGGETSTVLSNVARQPAVRSRTRHDLDEHHESVRRFGIPIM